MVIAKNGELRTKTGRAVTFVVAASNSEHKDEADYICDGTDDQVEIQAATDAVRASGGGSVILLDGTFVLASKIIEYYSVSNKGQAIQIKGQGKCTIIDATAINDVNGAFYFYGTPTSVTSDLTVNIDAGGYTASVANASIFSVGDYVRISSDAAVGANTLGEIVQIESIAANVITFSEAIMESYLIADSGKVTQLIMVNDLEISNLKITNAVGNNNGTGIKIQYGVRIHLHDLYIFNCYLTALQFLHVIQSEINSNFISGSARTGYGYATVLAGACKHINHHDNFIRDCIKVITVGGGPAIGKALMNISHHNFGLNVDHGFETHGESKYTTFESNMLNTTHGHSFAVLDDCASIRNNIVYNHNNDGVSFNSGVEVAGNAIKTLEIIGNRFFWNPKGTTGQEFGIRISQDAINVETINIKNNYFSGYKKAIQFYGSQKSATISGNIMKNPIVAGVGICFYSNPVFDSSNINISNNIIEGGSNLVTGIKIENGDNKMVSFVNISNNTIKNCTSYGVHIWATDTVANKTSNIIISKNHIYDDQGVPTQDYGIYLDGYIQDIQIKNNIIKGNTIAPIGATGTVAGNELGVYDRYFDLFMDILAASANSVHAAITGTGAEQEITTAITNPDVPRNVSITNSANSTGGVVITGVDAKGNSVTDTITIVTGGIAYGVVAFASVSKITIPSTVANPDTIAVGISDKLGLSNIIYANGDVYKVKVNNADDPTIGTVNTTYHTVDCAAINAADDITIWYKSNLNMIS